MMFPPKSASDLISKDVYRRIPLKKVYIGLLCIGGMNEESH